MPPTPPPCSRCACLRPKLPAVPALLGVHPRRWCLVQTCMLGASSPPASSQPQGTGSSAANDCMVKAAADAACVVMSSLLCVPAGPLPPSPPGALPCAPHRADGEGARARAAAARALHARQGAERRRHQVGTTQLLLLLTFCCCGLLPCTPPCTSALVDVSVHVHRPASISCVHPVPAPPCLCRWDHSDIKKDNPGVSLPATRVQLYSVGGENSGNAQGAPPLIARSLPTP
jgi:hypothetical protein